MGGGGGGGGEAVRNPKLNVTFFLKHANLDYWFLFTNELRWLFRVLIALQMSYEFFRLRRILPP